MVTKYSICYRLVIYVIVTVTLSHDIKKKVKGSRTSNIIIVWRSYINIKDYT